MGPNGTNPSNRNIFRLRRLIYQPYKYLLFMPLFALITLIMGTVSILFASLFNARVGMMVGGRPWAKLCCLVTPVFVRIKNKKHIIPGQSYVVVSNHQSLFDILVIAGWLDMDLRWVAKASLKKAPMFGIASVKMDHIFIDRSNRAAALETLNNAKKKIVNGTSVMFFPEGTRSRDGRIQDFKAGAFKMALDLNIPILPITVQGTRSILPSGTMDLFPGRATIVVHPPVDTTRYSKENLADLIERTRSKIASALN
jgi:1-acyl-sn-glycerol-3-phosphate acyltransferase